MILWMSVIATPQFTPVLNRLCNDYGFSLHAHYLNNGSGGREWGELDLRHPHTFHRPGSFLRDLVLGFKLSRRPDLRAAIVLGYNRPMAMGLLAGCRLRRIQVFTLSDSDDSQQRAQSWLRRSLKRLFLRAVYAPNTRVWTIGPSNSSFWRRVGLTNQKFIPFESPIPVQTSVVPTSPPAQPTVLYVGRFAEDKGTVHALRAVQKLHERGRPVVLRLIGQGDLADVDAFRGQPFVDFVGGVPNSELAVHYSEAACLVVPSRSEPYGLVVTEALQFGLPVVATNGVPAALQHCNHGWNIVEAGDVDALAAALEIGLTLTERWPTRQPADTARIYAEDIHSILSNARD